MRDKGRMGSILNGMVDTSRRSLGQDESFVVDSAPLDFGNDVPAPDAPTTSPAIEVPAQDFGDTITITSPDQVQRLAVDTPPIVDNPIFSAIDVNKLIQVGDAIYRYTRQTDASGSVKYIPQRVNVAQAGAKPSGTMIALGIAAALLLLH